MSSDVRRSDCPCCKRAAKRKGTIPARDARRSETHLQHTVTTMAKRSLKQFVHITTIEDPFGDPVYLVPVSSDKSWISRAIEERMPASSRWSEDLSAWLIDENVYDLLTEVIEKEAGHDSPWCPQCVEWLDDQNAPTCDTVEKMMEDIEEAGCVILHFDTIQPEKETMSDTGFRFPESLRKLVTEEGGELSKFLKGRAREILRKQVSASGMNIPDPVIDEVFEAFFNSMKGKMSDRATHMSSREAAAILGVSWPCTKEAVVAAWRTKARETHPDMPGGSNEAFMKAGAAREVLMGDL